MGLNLVTGSGGAHLGAAAEHHEGALRREAGRQVFPVGARFVGGRNAHEVPHAAAVVTSPALGGSVAEAVTGAPEDGGDDGIVGHEGEIGPGALVVDGDEPLDLVHVDEVAGILTFG